MAASDGDLLSKDVINKLDNLADQINADYYEDVDQEDLGERKNVVKACLRESETHTVSIIPRKNMKIS